MSWCFLIGHAFEKKKKRDRAVALVLLHGAILMRGWIYGVGLHCIGSVTCHSITLACFPEFGESSVSMYVLGQRGAGI